MVNPTRDRAHNNKGFSANSNNILGKLDEFSRSDPSPFGLLSGAKKRKKLTSRVALEPQRMKHLITTPLNILGPRSPPLNCAPNIAFFVTDIFA